MGFRHFEKHGTAILLNISIKISFYLTIAGLKCWLGLSLQPLKLNLNWGGYVNYETFII